MAEDIAATRYRASGKDVATDWFAKNKNLHHLSWSRF
jgi:hypothetical protein